MQKQTATTSASSKNLFLRDGTEDATGAASATTSGCTFFDTNDNGRYDIVGGDYSIYDLAVHLVGGNGVPVDNAITDLLGRYAFDDVARRLLECTIT